MASLFERLRDALSPKYTLEREIASGWMGVLLHRQLDVLEWERWLVPDALGYSFVARVPRDIVAQDMATEGQRQRFLNPAN
jgi:hypothetical protein